MKQVALQYTYPVGPQQDVVLSVRIGNGQVGGSVAQMSDKEQPIAPPGNLTNVRIGRGQELVGRSLVVRTLVADINPYSDETDISLDMNGDRPGGELTASASVEKEGDAVYYTATIKFVADGRGA